MIITQLKAEYTKLTGKNLPARINKADALKAVKASSKPKPSKAPRKAKKPTQTPVKKGVLCTPTPVKPV